MSPKRPASPAGAPRLEAAVGVPLIERDTGGYVGLTPAGRRFVQFAPQLVHAAQAANTARVESFTQCGKEADWSAQVGHFVAKAAVACVKPAEAGGNLAWDAAMQARMARTCQTVADGAGTDNREAEAQYRTLEAFLNS